MESRSTLNFIAIITLIAAIDQVLAFTGLDLNNNTLNILSGIIRLTIILLMIQDGTLFKSKISGTLTLMCIAITGIGALLKIMHWPFANALLLSGFVSFALFYSIRFLLKRPKSWLDFF